MIGSDGCKKLRITNCGTYRGRPKPNSGQVKADRDLKSLSISYKNRTLMYISKMFTIPGLLNGSQVIKVNYI